MRALVVLVVVGASCAAPAILAPTWVSPIAAPTSSHAPLPLAAPSTVISRHHAQDELGRASFGYAFPGQSQSEVRDAAGNVAGAFSYVDADGKPVVAQYTAGVGGFRIRANHLPVAGQPVKDTPEVTAAKEQFARLYNAAAIAAAEAPDEADGEVIVSGLDEEGNVVEGTLGFPGPVKDTPEVTEAKEKFVELYNAAALAAAEAQDQVESEGVVTGLDDEGNLDVEHRSENLAKATGPLVFPEPVRDTPEVTAAKEDFVKRFNAAAIAAAEAPDDPPAASIEVSGGKEVTKSTDLPVQSNIKAALIAKVLAKGLPEPVTDTPEVTAAKIEFMNLYNAAAIAAAEAPDDTPITTAADEESLIDSNQSSAESGSEVIAETSEAVTELSPDVDLGTTAPEVLVTNKKQEIVEANEVGHDAAAEISTETAEQVAVEGEADNRSEKQDALTSNNIDAVASSGGSVAIHAALFPSGSNSALAPWYVFGLTRGADGKLVPLLSQRPPIPSQAIPSSLLSNFQQGVYALPHAPHYIPPARP